MICQRYTAMIKPVACILLLTTLSMIVPHGDCKEYVRRRMDALTDEPQVEVSACHVLAPLAREWRDEIREMLAEGLDTKTILNIVLEKAQRSFVDKTIAHAKLIDGNDTNQDMLNLAELYEAKQSLAYSEMAKRVDPDLGIFYWILVPGTDEDFEESCQEVVREVNFLGERNEIDGVQADLDTDTYEIEAHPFAEELNDQLSVLMAERTNFLIDIGATATVVASVLSQGAIMLAKICRDYDTRPAEMLMP